MKQIEIYLKDKLVHAGTIKSGSQFLNFDLKPYIKYNIKLDNKIKYRIISLVSLLGLVLQTTIRKRALLFLTLEYR